MISLHNLKEKDCLHVEEQIDAFRLMYFCLANESEDLQWTFYKKSEVYGTGSVECLEWNYEENTCYYIENKKVYSYSSLEYAKDYNYKIYKIKDIKEFNVAVDIKEIGTKVVRGREWQWGMDDYSKDVYVENSSERGFGRIYDIPTDLDKNWVSVKWDFSGKSNSYRLNNGTEFSRADLHYYFKSVNYIKPKEEIINSLDLIKTFDKLKV